MSTRWIKEIVNWLKALFRGRAISREVNAEFEQHIEFMTTDNMEKGMPLEDARRAAVLKFGGVERYREESRDSWGTKTIASLGRNFLQATKSLRKAPGFALVSAITLGLGLGLTVAMFSFMNFLVLSPLQLEQKDEMIRVWRYTLQGQQDAHAAGTFLEMERQAKDTAKLAGFEFEQLTVSRSTGTPEVQTGLAVSPLFFKVLGVQPELGRGFTEEEFTTGMTDVVLLGYTAWEKWFAGDPAAVGSTIKINGEVATVVGVMPKSFFEPLLFAGTELFRPLRLTAIDRLENYENNRLQIIGRREKSVSFEQSEIRLETIFASIARDHPVELENTSIQILPLEEAIVKEGNAILFTSLLVGLSLAVLLIACANLANLQLNRALSRGREFALRAALGASRRQLVFALFCEGAILASLGGLVGLFVAMGVNDWLSGLFAAFIPVPLNISINFTVLCYGVGVTILAAIGFGLFPALSGSRVRLSEALNTQSRGSLGSKTQSRFLKLTIAVQFALALMLLSTAGFFLQGIFEATNRPVAWNPDNLLQGTLILNDKEYPSNTDKLTFSERLLERSRGLPGVKEVALSSHLPIREPSVMELAIQGQPLREEGSHYRAASTTISSDYFSTLQIGFISGRRFTRGDHADANQVVIINRSMATALFPDTNPIGQRIGNVDSSDPQWREIVGVVQDVEYSNKSNPVTEFQMYRPLSQEPLTRLIVAIRSNVKPENQARALRGVVAGVNPGLVLRNLSSVNEAIKQGRRVAVMIITVMSALAVLGLLLSTQGIYGVVSRMVTRRTGEIGIRIALGAQRRDVLNLVAGSGIRMALIGAGVGLIGTALLRPVLRKFNPTLSVPHDWLMIGGIVGVLLGVAFLAGYLPTLRISKINPADSLRAEG